MLTFHIITLFPESFDSSLKSSIIGRAIRNKKIAVKFYNPRDYVLGKLGKRKSVDDRPFGGGPGMVILAEPILRAVKQAKLKVKNQKLKTVIFSPAGQQFTNALGARWAKNYRHLFLICGHYEGIDARVKSALGRSALVGKVDEISVGPYILSGGELPAMILIDALTRQLPGVLGKDESVEERRAASPEVYTRPAELIWRGKIYRVPKVLLSGHHRQIEGWRQGKSGCG